MAGIVGRRMMPTVRMAAAGVALCACAWLAPPADAAITSVFTNTSTPVPCTVQGNGVRLCSAVPRSTVKSFDGVPIDVSVAFPPQPPSGPDGPYPLIMMFNGYASPKLTLNRMLSWLGRGYATFSMTPRGFDQSCGAPDARAADPAGCANGYVRLMDTRYEVRDAQELTALLADEQRIVPDRIGAWGGSYGGAMSLALAALRARKMLPDGSLVPWTSPGGRAMRIAAATPDIPWTDLMDALLPNGGTLDYVRDARYRGRTGVRKQSYEEALLYSWGANGFRAPEGSDPDADLTRWHKLFAAGEPYDDANGNPLPAIADIRDELTTHHSAYYIDDSQPPAPTMITTGWADDLFPTDEAIRFYQRTRSVHPTAPITLTLASIGHPRAQPKAGDWNLISERKRLWFEHYLKGWGSPPAAGVQALTQTCPGSAASGGPHTAPSYARLAPGEVRLNPPAAAQTILPTAGAQAIADVFDPLTGGGACATTSGATQAGTATYRMDVASGAFTLLGAPTVVADIASPGSNSQIAARLLDVDLAGNQTLIARGLWRPAIGAGAVRQIFQLHPNGWRFEVGHQVKLELLPKDSPYGQTSNGQQDVTVSNLQLRLPVLEPPGAAGGLVQFPAPRVVPSGHELAGDFQALTYVRPAGAAVLRGSLVLAYEQCTASNRVHGPPLAFSACRPPRQVSDVVTVGTPDANGRSPEFVGSARFDVIVGDPATPVDEADVRVSVSLQDVRRRGDLADYTGELRLLPVVRITDRTAEQEPSTTQDSPFALTVPCAATPGSAGDVGATCSVTTTFDAVAPGALIEGRRAMWQMGAVEVHDGGSDGLAATGPNELFARQGLFIP